MIRRMMQVFFDGSCPMCVREVAVYRRASPPDIVWHDLSVPALEIPAGSGGYRPERSQLLQRFHIYNENGQWLHGAPAFVCLWRRLALAWRTLALIGRLPGGLWFMDRVYDLFLRIRPSMQSMALQWFRPDWLPAHMVASLRSDHAGETGAVWIYRSMRWFTRDKDLQRLLESHMKQEQVHLDAMNRILPWRFRSRLLALWVLAGILTGSIPGLLGRRWMLGTIVAVERFVDVHYLEQIEVLRSDASKRSLDTANQPDCSGALQCGIGSAKAAAVFAPYPDLLSMLEAFRHDELDHRDDAIAGLGPTEDSLLFRFWCALVGQGSAVAVRIAKLI